MKNLIILLALIPIAVKSQTNPLKNINYSVNLFLNNDNGVNTAAVQVGLSKVIKKTTTTVIITGSRQKLPNGTVQSGLNFNVDLSRISNKLKS